MSVNPFDDDTDESLWEQIGLATDPFDITLDDIPGLDAECEKIEQLIIPGLTDPDAAARLPSLLVYGPEGAGQDQLARAVVTELPAHGFDTALLPAQHAIPRKLFNQNQHHETEVAQLVQDLLDNEPVVLLFEGLEQMHLEADGALHDAVDEVREALGARLGSATDAIEAFANGVGIVRCSGGQVKTPSHRCVPKAARTPLSRLSLRLTDLPPRSGSSSRGRSTREETLVS